MCKEQRFNKKFMIARILFIVLFLVVMNNNFALETEASSPNKVDTPSVSVKAGTYTSSQKVKLSTKTKGATIYYTTNGKTPNKRSKKYENAITVSKTTTIKAIAYKSGHDPSEVRSAKYSIRVETPKVNKYAGTYTSSQKVKLSTKTKGATIYYTTNGKTPTKNSKKYKNAITISKDTVIKARAYKSGLATSKTITAKYVVEIGRCYSACNAKEKALYKEIYNGIVNFQNTIPIRTPNVTLNELAVVYRRVNRDHPQLMQMPNNYMYSSTNANVVSLSLDYAFSREKTKSMLAEMDKRVNQILKKADKQKNLYGRVKVIHDEIITNIVYDKTNITTGRSAYGALVKGTGVCEAYSRAFQYICQKAGIPVMLVIGYANEAHMWNMIQLDGDWYHIDLTWNDPAGKSTDSVSYDYFNITTAAIKADHQIYKTVTSSTLQRDDEYYNVCNIPNAKATKYNYLTYNGIKSYSTYDKAVAGLYSELQKALKEKKGSITLYCSNAAVNKAVIDNYVRSGLISNDIQKLNNASTKNKFSSISTTYGPTSITLSLFYQ